MKDETPTSPPLASEEEERLLSTRPLSKHEQQLQDAFWQQFTSQAERMDKLADQLLTIQLGIPGLYATVLKLLHGQNSTVPLTGWVIAVFIIWTVALTLTLASLVPRRWAVDVSKIQTAAYAADSPMGLQNFFKSVAQYKRRLLIASIGCFWVGVVAAAVLFTV